MFIVADLIGAGLALGWGLMISSTENEAMNKPNKSFKPTSLWRGNQALDN